LGGVDPTTAAGAIVGFIIATAAGPAGRCSPLHATPVDPSFLFEKIPVTWRALSARPYAAVTAVLGH